MNIVKEFCSLQIPKEKGSDFNAVQLKQYAFAKIGVNKFGFPVILIDSKSDKTFLTQKNIRLEYLELNHNLECKISEKGNSKYSNFTIIIFKSNELTLQKYFLGIAENLLNELTKNPSQDEVYNTFRGFIEIFRAMSNPPKTTVQGLWCELLLIATSKNPQTLLEFWHNMPEEKFDFNADIEKIEVKSSSSLERKHIFTSDQLNSPKGKEILIASIFARQSANGKNIADLMDSIKSKVDNVILLDKLSSIVGATLGNALEQGLRVKFDYDLAKDSINYYQSSKISKIEEIHIPSKVSELKYKSDLTKVETVIPHKISLIDRLFSGV